ncbi:MAG: hypothetical protein WCV79_03480 [Candidatus Paceibacterota bacterium]
MSNKKIVLIVIILAIMGAASYFLTQKKTVEIQTNDTSNDIPVVSNDTAKFGVKGAIDFKNATYTIEDRAVTLKDGYEEEPADPGSITTTVTDYFGNEARGDLNGDSKEDVAFILTQNSGGSGTFCYVVVALLTDNGYVGTNAIYLGDRISPQSSQIKDGILTVNYADRKAGEPMSTQPSVGVSKYLSVKGALLQEFPVPQ